MLLWLLSVVDTQASHQQSFHEFVAERENLNDDCEFGTIKDTLVIDFIIWGVNNDSGLQEQEDGIDLTKVIEIGQAAEQQRLMNIN